MAKTKTVIDKNAVLDWVKQAVIEKQATNEDITELQLIGLELVAIINQISATDDVYKSVNLLTAIGKLYHSESVRTGFLKNGTTATRIIKNFRDQCSSFFYEKFVGDK